jgi:hypothetical protein
MYTLEQHLEACSHNSSQFEQLNAIWKLNKKLLPQAQNAISFNFPHYSLHERSHSETIIKNIESFLGIERVKQLSPTDSWLILMAAFTHDLGMIVFHSVLEKKWIDDDFQSYLQKMTENEFDKDVKNAAILLLNIQKNGSEKNIQSSLTLPLEIRQAVILVTADYFRKYHHYRSKELLAGMDDEFNRIVNGFSLTGIPNRFANVLAEVAYCHGIDFYNVFERLEYEADGIGSDKMHPRFIAYLIRLGDLLDVDDKRFNIFSSKVFSQELPVISKSHEEKHASVKHLLISPQAIEITVDCKTDDVYRVARQWFDWLQIEVQNQAKEWSGIAAFLPGLPPTISLGKLKVLYRSAEPTKELMNLRFNISNEKVFEMLEGSAIYEKAEFVFLRELIQNAIDASKIQLWKLILSGFYDHTIKSHLKTKSKNHQELLEEIQFPTDIPNSLWQNFEIDLNITWLDDKQTVLRIVVEDHGTGISEKNLIRMTQKVGESRSRDSDYHKFRESMPYWLLPTGAFGIGLQSLFLISHDFKVQTKTDEEEPKEIIFVSAKFGEYSKITNEKPTMTRGTKVIVDIPKNRFSEIFSTSFDVGIIEGYDRFTDEYGDMYIYKIRSYILKEFHFVDQLNVFMINKRLMTSKLNNGANENPFENCSHIRQEDVIVYLYSNNETKNLFLIFQKITLGSSISINFFSSFSKEAGSSYYHHPNSVYLVRDIPVDESFPSYYATSYCSIIWDLESPESDKILNISRDKFIKKKKEEFNKTFLHSIWPKSLIECLNLFESEYKNLKEDPEQLATQYFHMQLSALMTELSIKNSAEIYRDFTLSTDLVSNLDLTPVTYRKFFEAKSILLFSKEYFNSEDSKSENLLARFTSVISENKHEADFIVWDTRYFASFFKLSDYQIAEHYTYLQSNGIEVIQILTTSKLHITVKTNGLGKKFILDGIRHIRRYSNRRNMLLPIEQYSDVLAVNSPIDGFHSEFSHAKHFIISPFKSLSEIVELQEHLKDHLESDNFNIIQEVVRKSYIENLVTDKLIEFIVENSTSVDKASLNREKILTSYSMFVVEVLLLKFNESPTLENFMKSKTIQINHLYD